MTGAWLIRSTELKVRNKNVFSLDSVLKDFLITISHLKKIKTNSFARFYTERVDHN